MDRTLIIQVTASGIAFLTVFYTGMWWFTRKFRSIDQSKRERFKTYVANKQSSPETQEDPPQTNTKD